MHEEGVLVPELLVAAHGDQVFLEEEDLLLPGWPYSELVLSADLDTGKELQQRTAVIGVVDGLVLLVVLLIPDDPIGYVVELLANHL